MARIAQDDDQLIVNRGNVDYCAKVSEVFPSVCDLEELEDTSLPWDDHDGGVWHVKEANGTVYVRNGPHKAYDVTVDAKGKVSWSEKGEISEIGSGEEVVFLTSSDATELFEDNKIRDWKFGELTDTSKVNIMYGLFYKCENFTGDVTGFDVSNVTTMRYMFWQCRKYYATDSELNSWDVSNVTDMSMMFRSCSYNKPLDNWNVSACTDMKWMFRDSSFNQDIGGWDVSNVESMAYMFYGTSTFNQDISGWNTGNVTSMGSMFDGNKWFTGDISKWDTSKVEIFSSMFRQNKVFNGDISGWDTSSANDMRDMFSESQMFNQDLSQWCVINVRDKSGFDFKTPQWTEPKPVWGTCPRGENIKP